MENRSHALIAGVFSLLLGFSVVAALWWFGGKHEAVNEYLVIDTRNATGLNLQAQVRYRGIRVGKVESIELDPNDVSRTLIGISVTVDVRPQGSLPRSQGKAARVLDHRIPA